MKLHYNKILLFVLPLHILVSSSTYAHNKNKPYITTRHTAISKSRMLSEEDIQSSIYNNDADIKSVKEIFHRQTSQRFVEYEERMQEKRQKRKEQRDKNIEEIIEKDKTDKSLAEKIEKGCLKCGCGLSGVAASVGLFGGLGTYGWKSSAIAAAAKAAGDAAGAAKVIQLVNLEFGVSTLNGQALQSVFTSQNYTSTLHISKAIEAEYNTSSCIYSFTGTSPGSDKSICISVWKKSKAALDVEGGFTSPIDVIEEAVKSIVAKAQNAAAVASETATEDAIKSSTLLVDGKYIICQNAIIASVVTLLIIVLIMIIIYLVLRYRRKKKMNKKAEYTKLLNQ
ncbi:rifin [Plasmodium reichenowi]|uniref:Rifin n=1 Tax=Plasmodium reichenowi TaxID=5854 RepID=A0A060RM91_PLARE|nr:rifin [Plasmodium reichenowi]